MTAESFAVLVATTAMATVLVVDLRVPFGALRRWLLAGDHVETLDDLAGPWWVVRDGQREEPPHPSPAAAAAHLSGPQRARAWLAELVSCPWCAGGWVSLGVVVGFACLRGADVLAFWPAVWFASAASVVAVRRLAS